MSDHIKNTNDQSFAGDVLQSPGLKLVDFWAPWCGPCLKIAPALESLAQAYEGRVEVQKLNVDESPSTAAQFGVRGIPTLLVFRDGKEIDRIVGAVPKESIEKSLTKHLSDFNN